MNDNNEVIFRTVLYVDDKIVASSSDLDLWQDILTTIKSNKTNNSVEKTCNNNNIQRVDKEVTNSSNSLLERFAKEIEVDCDMIKDACNPSEEAPFIRLDMKTWENYKRKHFENKRALPDVVIAGTILALWKKSANLGDATQKEVIKILKQLNILATNPTRSYKNCEWLKYENGKIVLMATKYSLAQRMFLEYCQSV